MGLLYSDNSVRNTPTYNNTLKINACSGGIYKTYKESWFIRFNLTSKTAETLFNPYKNELTTNIERKKKDYPDNFGFYDYYDEEKKEKVIILQMIICGDMEVIAEVIKEKDFNNYFEIRDNVDLESKGE